MGKYLFISVVFLISCNIDRSTYKYLIVDKKIHKYKSGWGNYEDYYIKLSNNTSVRIYSYQEFLERNVGDTVYIRCGSIYYNTPMK